jgi:hypothetical protein
MGFMNFRQEFFKFHGKVGHANPDDLASFPDNLRAGPAILRAGSA